MRRTVGLTALGVIAAIRRILDGDVDRRPDSAPSPSKQRYAFQSSERHDGSSIMLTWAATMRQPSGKRTQVCICRPTLPAALSRRNRVAATAQSRP